LPLAASRLTPSNLSDAARIGNQIAELGIPCDENHEVFALAFAPDLFRLAYEKRGLRNGDQSGRHLVLINPKAAVPCTPMTPKNPEKKTNKGQPSLTFWFRVAPLGLSVTIGRRDQ
jgi:hypothetical protein